ncbi:hypothetical protein ACLX1H_006536 [Fusarium chlamydosporum]
MEFDKALIDVIILLDQVVATFETNMSTVSRVTATLAPDVRLMKALSDFGAALDKKYQPIFKTWRTLSPPSESDVINLTEEVNRDGVRLHQSSWKPFGTRLLKILDQIQFLVKPGDILVSGSQNMIASGVWATVRVSLDIAVAYLSYFETISDLLMKLGHATIIQRDRMRLFPNDSDLKAFSCEYLIIIIEICQLIVSYERKSFIAQLTSTIALDKTFKEYETKLTFWSKMINKKLSYLNENSHNSTVTMIREGMSFWNETRTRQAEDWRIQVLHRLSPYQDKFDTAWRRERRKGSVEWIFNDRRFSSWKSATSSSTLLLHGPMGTGKTVTMANITGKILPGLTTQAQAFEASQFAAASFFFQYLVPETLVPATVLGSIAHQFLKSLKCSVDHPAIRNFPKDSTGNDADAICDYMKTYLPNNYRYYLVLDALDELDIDCACEILQPLASLQAHLKFKICCSARTESSVRRLMTQKLHNVKLMSISSVEKDREIESYIDGELLRRSLSQSLSPAYRKSVRDALVIGAQGMYLWVVLQLDSLFPLYGQNVTCQEDLKNILTHLPTGLFDAFESALARILDREHESRIFEIVAAAERPLTKNELRSALNINPGVTLWDPSTLALDPDAMVYCYSAGLLQIDEEDDTVRFMHHSVLRHLLRDDPEADGLLKGLHEEEGKPEQAAQEPHPVTQPSLSLRHSSECNQKKHRQDRFLFSSHQADTTIGFLCLTCLHLKPHDRRVRQSKKFVVNTKTCQMISKSAVPENLLTNVITAMLQGHTIKHDTQNFDITRIMEDLSNAPPSIDIGEGLSFHNYAETYWLDHTSRACFDQRDEKTFHSLFVSLIRDNSPGLSFPWRIPQRSNSILTWAQTNRHSRLLYELLSESTGVEFTLQRNASSRYLMHFPLDGLLRCVRSGEPTIISAIRASWEAGYQILFSYGARVSHALEDLGEHEEPFHMMGIDLAMFRGADADAMIQDLVDSGASIGNYFRVHPWPVRSRDKHGYSGAPRRSSMFSGEDDDWVIIQDAEFQQRDYLDVDNSTQTDRRVLRWICRTKCDPDITSINGMTPLGLAIELQDSDLTMKLLDSGATPDKPYKDRVRTFPLFSALKNHDVKVVRLLICSGAPLRVWDSRYYSRGVVEWAKDQSLNFNNLASIDAVISLASLPSGNDGEEEQTLAAVQPALSTLAEAVRQPGTDLNKDKKENLRLANEFFIQEMQTYKRRCT